MQPNTASPTLQLHGLAPNPGAEWQRLLDFVGFNDGDKVAMSRTVQALLQCAHELVASTYNHLRSVPETAAILGWEQRLDEEHLEERRRFFTIWLCRTLGADTIDEFAFYLFRAGKYHAGHGPRHIHLPPAFVTASIGREIAAIADSLPPDLVEATRARGRKRDPWTTVNEILVELEAENAHE